MRTWIRFFVVALVVFTFSFAGYRVHNTSKDSHNATISKFIGTCGVAYAKKDKEPKEPKEPKKPKKPKDTPPSVSELPIKYMIWGGIGLIVLIGLVSSFRKKKKK